MKKYFLLSVLVFFTLFSFRCQCEDDVHKDQQGGTNDDLFSNEESEYFSDHHQKLKDLVTL